MTGALSEYMHGADATAIALDLAASHVSVTGMDDLLAHENTSILSRNMQGFWLTDDLLTNVEDQLKARMTIIMEITSACCSLGKDVAEPG